MYHDNLPILHIIPNSRSYLSHFTQPDTIVPTTTQGAQAWDRYAYSNNNPVRYADPSGHCIWDGCIAEVMVLGAVIGAGVDLIAQLQTTPLDSVNWKEVAVAGAVGAVAGGAGVVIAAGAAVLGAEVIAATGSTLLGGTIEVGIGSVAAGTTNVILNNTQRAATDIVSGETVTKESIRNDFEENFVSDMAYGAAGYGIGKTFSSIAEGFWSPHEFVEPPPVFGEPLLSAPTGGVTDLLNMHPGQNIVTGSASVLSQSVSNSTLIEFWHRHRLEEK